MHALNKKDLTFIEELIAPDYVDHTNPLRDGEDIKQFYDRVFKDLPDFQRTIEDIIAEGESVGSFQNYGNIPSWQEDRIINRFYLSHS